MTKPAQGRRVSSRVMSNLFNTKHKIFYKCLTKEKQESPEELINIREDIEKHLNLISKLWVECGRVTGKYRDNVPDNITLEDLKSILNSYISDHYAELKKIESLLAVTAILLFRHKQLEEAQNSTLESDKLSDRFLERRNTIKNVFFIRARFATLIVWLQMLSNLDQSLRIDAQKYLITVESTIIEIQKEYDDSLRNPFLV